jgi:glycosyltransferase involved in cell wall biosynthesis
MTELLLPEVVILIADDHAAGGVQRSAVNIRDALAAAGLRVQIRAIKLFEGGYATRVQGIAAISPARSSRLVFWLQFALHFRRLLVAHRDAVFIALGLAPTVFLSTLSLGARSSRLIGSERIYPPAETPGLAMRVARRIFYRRLNFVVVQSQLSITWFRDFLRLPMANLVLIPNVVRRPDTTTSSRVANRHESGRPVIVCVGRLTEQKGFDYALEAFSLVRSACPEARMLIVGEGPLDAALRQTAARLGIADDVAFLPPLSDLGEIWRGTDVFFLPSRYEGFPNVLAEAMAHGVPAVAFDCPTGPSDLIRHGENGFLTGVGDVRAAADYVIELLRNQQLRSQMGDRAKEVASTFSPDVVGGKWLSLVRRVIAGHERK